jgi:hypothetical protein
VSLSDNPGLTGSCLLTVTVREVNIHAPVFLFPSEGNSSIRVMSGQDVGAWVTTVAALDPDMGSNRTEGQITYKLRRTLSNDWRSFEVEATSGRVLLKTGLDVNRQAVYVLEVLASDHGRPGTLESRASLTLVVVDSANNAVQFDRSVKQSPLVVEVVEEKSGQTFEIPAARMNDVRKRDEEICYYLSGVDSGHFWLNGTGRVVSVMGKLDREKKQEYEVFVRAAEYCGCESGGGECGFMEKPLDVRDVSQMLVKVRVIDVNDNAPVFGADRYQLGITSDVEFDEVILESYVS